MATIEATDQLYESLDDKTVEILESRRRTSGIRRRGWLVRRALLTADLLGLSIAFIAAQEVYAFSHHAGMFSRGAEFLTFAISLPLWVVAAKLYGLYEKDVEEANHSTANDFTRLFHLVTVCTFFLYTLSHLTAWFSPASSKPLLFWFFAISVTTGLRVVARALCRQQVAYVQNTVIVGAGDVGQIVARKLLQHPEYGLNLVGFVDDNPKKRREDLGHLTMLGSPEDLPSLVTLLDIERVIFAFSNNTSREQVDVIRQLRDVDVQIDVVPRLFDVIGPRVDIHDVEGLPVLSLRPARLSRSSRFCKRVADVIGASLGLVVTAPLFLWIAWRVKRDSDGPVFFRQTRLGIDQRTFTFLKFRSMRVDTDPVAHLDYIARSSTGVVAQEPSGLFKLEQRESVTRFGEWLRRTSLDELPQLLNVLRGDMSLVGPRPCIPYETQYFEPYHFERFNVPAGLTGLWQVTARAHTTFREALDLDVAYARGWSIGLDLRLLAQTPLQMMRSRVTQ